MTVGAPVGSRLNRAEFTVRAVEVADREDVAAISAQVWDGNDYIPAVFDEWVGDAAGHFCAGVIDDQVVAVARLAHMHEGQWWLEGLRVDPAYRGLGIGRVLHHYLVNYSRRFAPGTLRFSTASDNGAIIKMADELGFRQVAEFAAYGASADPDQSLNGLSLLKPSDIDRAWSRLISLPHFDSGQHTLEENWRFTPLTPDQLRSRLEAGMVYAWRGGSGFDEMDGLVILGEARHKVPFSEERPKLLIAYADAVYGEMTALAAALRGLAAERGLERVSWKPLHTPDLLADLKRAGYENRWDMYVLLFARELSLVEHAIIVDRNA